MGSKVCSQINGYKPKDFFEVQQNKSDKNIKLLLQSDIGLFYFKETKTSSAVGNAEHYNN